MDINNIEKDGDSTRPLLEAPSIGEVVKPKLVEGTIKKKRRRGKSKRKVMKTYMKPWQERRRNDKTKRNNRFRKIVLAKTHAPFNNNQFLMEIHKPEPENSFHVLQTPSARTRDSSFSVDSEDNYFFSLPEDEEEYLTKEFSSVYEDAQSERLSNMSKNELIQEYLLLEAKYDNLVKRTERLKPRSIDDDRSNTVTEKDTSVTDRDSMITERDTSATSVDSSAADEPSMEDIMLRLKEQEDQIRELQLANEKLRQENESFHQRPHSSSEDSESDSSSTSMSTSSSSSSMSPDRGADLVNGDVHIDDPVTNGGQSDNFGETEPACPLVNGFHDSVN